MYRIPLLTSQTYHILNRNKSKFGTRITIMIGIDEREEELIDNIKGQVLYFRRGDKVFSVSMRDIYCYGEVDFNNDDIIDQIENFGFLDYLDEVGVRVRSRYDYETHSCNSPRRTCLWTETWSPSLLAKMAHGYLGKPERILLFRQSKI